MKTAALATLDAMIAAAPPDPATVSRSRAAKVLKSKTSGNAGEGDDRKFLFHLATATGEEMRRASVSRVTLTVGPVSYSLWNTRENLESFRKRFKSKFP